MRGILSFILIIYYYLSAAVNASYTLEQVHIFFRHGEKFVDHLFSYPNDPYINTIADTSRPGLLTKKGQKMMLNLGKRIRGRYKKLIDDFYPTENIQAVEAVSSSYPRSIISLQLVLAGLFPPTIEEKVEPNLNWQPIPYTYIQQERDNIFLTILSCPEYTKTLKNYVKSREFQNEIKLEKDILKYISKKTGKPHDDYLETSRLLDYLRIQERIGLILPDWTRRIYPKILHNMALKGYEQLVATTQLKRMFTGHFFQKLIKDYSNKKTKMFLNSGHDINIMGFLKVLELYETHIPGYGAMIIFEVHKSNQSYFKLFYSRNVTHKIELLKIPKCEHLCPVDKFTALIKEYLPGPLDCTMTRCANEGFKYIGNGICFFMSMFLVRLV